MQAFVGPHKTPKSIKVLIWIIVLTSLFSPILTFVLNHYAKISGPTQWFALSRWGLMRGWVWQPLTYFFIHSPGVGISLSLLISLFFHMLLLWFAGSEIVSRFGTHSFLLFYFGGGVFAGVIAALAQVFFSSRSVVLGSGPPIYALLIIWAMLYPELQLYFLFFVRVKAKWLVAILLGIALLVNLSYGQFIPFLADACGIVWGFLIGKSVWKLSNPFPITLPKRPRPNGSNKIIDITVFHEGDEAFMDRMLDKIAKDGKDSLTRREKERMKKISARKKK